MPCLIEGDESEVRRRIHSDNVSRTDQGFADSLSGGNARLTNRRIQAVLKQGLELDTQESTFSKQSSVLLHLSDKLSDRATVGDDDGLTEKCAALGTTDVEDIG